MSQERIEYLENNQQHLINSIKSLLGTVSDLVKVVDENFQQIKTKIDNLESKIDNLDGSTEQGFKDVKWELKKIQDVTKYADEYLNLPSARGQA